MERELRGYVPEDEITADAVIIDDPKPIRFDKKAEIAESRKVDTRERSTFHVPESISRETSHHELADRAPDFIPLHNTFISVDLGRRKNDALTAEYNSVSTEDYLNEGRGEESIDAARRIDLIKFENVRNQEIRGASIKKKLEAEKLKKQAENELGVLEQMGTVLQLGRDAGRELSKKIDGFTERIVQAMESSQQLIAAANERLFAVMRPVAEATPDQRVRLGKAQAAHKLATKLEKAA